MIWCHFSWTLAFISLHRDRLGLRDARANLAALGLRKALGLRDARANLAALGLHKALGLRDARASLAALGLRKALGLRGSWPGSTLGPGLHLRL